MAVFFEDGKALIAEDCLYAIYDVLKMAILFKINKMMNKMHHLTTVT